MIGHDFILSQLLDLLPAPDVYSLVLLCHSCHDFIRKELEKILGSSCHDEHPFYGGYYRQSSLRTMGETELRVLMFSPSLIKIRHLMSINTMELLSAPQYAKYITFFIRIYNTQSKFIEVLYLGKYIKPDPRSGSRIDICVPCPRTRSWKKAVFLRKEDEYMIVRLPKQQKYEKIHCLSPRLAPAAYQVNDWV